MGVNELIATAKIYKDEMFVQPVKKQPTWKDSKDLLKACDARNMNPVTVRTHYRNYIENRPAHDKLRIGKTSNNRQGALEGLVRAKYLLMVIHKFKCPVCGKVYKDPKTQRISTGVKFHHVVPLYDPKTKRGSGNNDITNIVPVCSENCHKKVHYQLERGKNILAAYMAGMR